MFKPADLTPPLASGNYTLRAVFDPPDGTSLYTASLSLLTASCNSLKHSFTLARVNDLTSQIAFCFLHYGLRSDIASLGRQGLCSAGQMRTSATRMGFV